MSATFLLVCFSILKESTCETWKKNFNSLDLILFLLSATLNFSILEIQISWRHQMPKHRTRNTFYWIICEANKVYVSGIRSVYVTLEKKKIEKFYKNCDLENSSRPFCFWKELSTSSFKMKFLTKATYIRYVLAKLSKVVQISTLTSSGSFFTIDYIKVKKGLN